MTPVGSHLETRGMMYGTVKGYIAFSVSYNLELHLKLGSNHGNLQRTTPTERESLVLTLFAYQFSARRLT